MQFLTAIFWASHWFDPLTRYPVIHPQAPLPRPGVIIAGHHRVLWPPLCAAPPPGQAGLRYVIGSSPRVLQLFRTLTYLGLPLVFGFENLKSKRDDALLSRSSESPLMGCGFTPKPSSLLLLWWRFLHCAHLRYSLAVNHTSMVHFFSDQFLTQAAHSLYCHHRWWW